jgi:hypothetical protein
MKTKAQVETKSLSQDDWYRVTVTGFVEDNPPLLAFYSLLTLSNGTQKRCGQVVRVLDTRLIQLLRTVVKPGDEIRVSTDVDLTVRDCPTILKDLCPVSKPS